MRSWRDPGLFEVSKEYIYKYTYDELGNIIEAYHYYDGALKTKIENTYNYDDKGRIIEIIEYDCSNIDEIPVTEADEPAKLYSRYQFFYDKKGNLIGQENYGRVNELLGRIAFEYQ